MEIYERRVACRNIMHLLSSARSCPSRPALIRSSIIKESFCSWLCRLGVSYSRYRLSSLMKFHVWDIHEGLMHWDIEFRLFVKERSWAANFKLV